MNRRNLLVVCLLVLCVCPAQAQWYRRLGRVLEHTVPAAAFRGMTPGQAGLSHASLERAVRQASAAAQVHPCQKAVFMMKEKDWFTRFMSIEGTGFALEETYQGKKYVWGITASHYLYQKPAVKLPNHWRAVLVPVVVQGHALHNDVTLFPLPDEIAAEVVPLKLAKEEIEVGEELSSVGYWDHRLHVDPVRRVKKILPLQLITTLDIEPTTIREGTCGSPMLNKNGEVVGMHVGNSPHKQEGYMVSAAHIRQALQAYHEGKFEQPLFFNGINIGTLAINEGLSSAEVRSAIGQVRRFGLEHRQKHVDYEHLEKLVPLQDTDTHISFLIKRNPLTTGQEDQRMYTFTITYDLKTGQIVRSEPQAVNLF